MDQQLVNDFSCGFLVFLGVGAAFLLGSHCAHTFTTSKNYWLENIGLGMAAITALGLALFVGYAMTVVGDDIIKHTQGAAPDTSYSAL